ncbi:MAG: hypothetical protein J6Z43_10490 [Clostridiales bacterium]|nr:hypothetical protein [Clostridiales bacterium]
MRKFITVMAATLAITSAIVLTACDSDTAETTEKSEVTATTSEESVIETDETEITETTEESAATTEVDHDHYSAVTAMGRLEVEAFAADMRQAYLDGDWETIAINIRYPITMYPDVRISNTAEFLEYVKDKTVAPEDAEWMRKDTCTDMFMNGEGICLGTGQLWLNDSNYMTSAHPNLKIIAVSGLV